MTTLTVWEKRGRHCTPQLHSFASLHPTPRSLYPTTPFRHNPVASSTYHKSRMPSISFQVIHVPHLHQVTPSCGLSSYPCMPYPRTLHPPIPNSHPEFHTQPLYIHSNPPHTPLSITRISTFTQFNSIPCCSHPTTLQYIHPIPSQLLPSAVHNFTSN